MLLTCIYTKQVGREYDDDARPRQWEISIRGATFESIEKHFTGPTKGSTRHAESLCLRTIQHTCSIETVCLTAGARPQHQLRAIHLCCSSHYRRLSCGLNLHHHPSPPSTIRYISRKDMSIEGLLSHHRFGNSQTRSLGMSAATHCTIQTRCGA
jgi:hypothetical protein